MCIRHTDQAPVAQGVQEREQDPPHGVACLRRLALRQLRASAVRLRVYSTYAGCAELDADGAVVLSHSIVRAFLIEEQKIVKKVLLEKLKKSKTA